MGLKSRLEAMKSDFIRNADPVILEKMQHATRVLEEPDHLAFVLNVGERAPEFSLNDARGQAVSSQDLLLKGRLLVAFYRGVW